MDIALALILHPTDPKVLIARRRKGSHLAEFWEFPGGKIEPGESASVCAVREAKEEVGLSVTPRASVFQPVRHEYLERTVTLYPVLCQARNADAKPLASDALRWVGSDELSACAFPPANDPIVAALQSILDRIV